MLLIVYKLQSFTHECIPTVQIFIIYYLLMCGWYNNNQQTAIEQQLVSLAEKKIENVESKLYRHLFV